MQTVELPKNSHANLVRYFDDAVLSPFIYALSKKMEQGNICLELDALPTAFMGSDANLLQLWKVDYDALKAHHLVAKNEKDVKPFVLMDNRLYTHRMYHYERKFLNYIQLILKNNTTDAAMKLLVGNNENLKFASSLFPIQNAEMHTNWQFIACMNAFINNFSIITGGPGTGKTTVVSKLLALLIKSNDYIPLKILLAAPTGKARARMEESLGNIHTNFQREEIEINDTILELIKSIKPQTIHSMLGYQKGSIYFKYNESNYLDADVVVVDECSMIDIALFTKMLSAINSKRTKIILLGDRNQLASVEAGSLFGDLCRSMSILNEFDEERIQFFNKISKQNTNLTVSEINKSHTLFQHIAELKHSYRFDDNSSIGKFSKAVLSGDWEAIKSFQNPLSKGVIALFETDETYENIAPKSADEWLLYFQQKIKSSYLHEKNTAQALVTMNQYKVLCALKKGRKASVDAFNAIMRDEIKDDEFNELNFYDNQMIMVTQNQKELNLDNGDIGIVRKDEQGAYKAYFAKDEINENGIHVSMIQNFVDAYAMSIHKSQGSEFDHVLIILPDEESIHAQFLTRELLYTAVTRAKKSAIIIAPDEVLQSIVMKKIDRISGINEAL